MKLTLPARLAGVLLIAALGVSGCATQEFVKKKVGYTNKAVAVQGQRLDQDDVKMADLDRTSREALDRATAAGKLAEGKFLYSMVLSDDSVKFPVNGSELSPEAQARLQDLMSKLKDENKNVYLEIQGHTDSSGTKAGNMRLGEERAEAVRRFMNQGGVPLNRMATISYGDGAPVADNHTRTGRAQNRRVVIIVMA